MAQLQLSVAFAHFPYGGNGAAAKEHPDIRDWEVETVLEMKKDSRIKDFSSKPFNDTPITMTRNRAMREAKKAGVDLLLMVDSDQSPNRHKGEPWYKPFWKEAFNFLYENYSKGPRLIFAPYCGPPGDEGGENVFVFHWANSGARGPETRFKLQPYSREHAAIMSGIQEAGAGPTGMLLLDTRLLDLIEPSGLPRQEVLERVATGRMSVEEAMWALKEGYCHYEWTNSYAEEKASTEDVTLTRDISMAGIEKLGYNPVFCAWDSWIGHWKPWNVGKPTIYSADHVAETLKRAVVQNHRDNEAIIDIGNLNAGDREFDALKSLPPAIQERMNGHLDIVPEDITTKTGRETNGPWHAHGSAAAIHKGVLVDLVRSQGYQKQRDIRILEVGTWLGGTAMAMADASQHAKVHCVDTWEGTPSDCTGRLTGEAGGPDAVYQEFLSRIGDRLNKTIFPWRGTSLEQAAKHWQQFDVIFIDADHSYEAVKADIAAWWPHLRHDGVMIGHDFHVHGYDGLVKAVEESFGEVEAVGFHPQGCMWKVRKADVPELLEAAK